MRKQSARIAVMKGRWMISTARTALVVRTGWSVPSVAVAECWTIFPMADAAYLVTCAVNQIPCPLDQQGILDLAALLDMSLLGITPESVAKAIGASFTFVLSAYLVGYFVGIKVGLIRRL